MPAVTHLHRDAGVARLAQRHEIVGTAATTFGERKDVVDFLSRRKLALLLTLLAEWMLVDVSHPDLSPLASVPFMSVVATGEVVVLLLH